MVLDTDLGGDAVKFGELQLNAVLARKVPSAGSDKSFERKFFRGTQAVLQKRKRNVVVLDSERHRCAVIHDAERNSERKVPNAIFFGSGIGPEL